jgi:hypothetical protein
MRTTNTLKGGGFRDAAGSPISKGYLIFENW